MRSAARWVLLASVAVACAPTVDGPVERQAAADRADAASLGTQLGALPGVVRAEVILHRSPNDPLAVAVPSLATLSIVLVIDDQADRTKVERFASVLARAHGIVEPTLVVEVGAKRAQLATVGPITVEAGSKSRLKALFVVALAIIAALAAWIASIYYRRGNSAQ